MYGGVLERGYGLVVVQNSAEINFPAESLDDIFLNTSTSVGPRAPAGRPGSMQSGNWALPAGLGHQKARPGLDRPKGPRAARGPAGLLRPLGQAWAEGNGKLATCRHRADSGGETV